MDDQFLRNALEVALWHILIDVGMKEDDSISANPVLRPPDKLRLVVNKSLTIGDFVLCPELEQTVTSMMSAVMRTLAIVKISVKSVTLSGIRRDCHGQHEHTIIF